MLEFLHPQVLEYCSTANFSEQMCFKAKGSRRKSSPVVSRQRQSLILPGSYSDSTVDFRKEVEDPLGINFSTRKFKTIILFSRYLQGIVSSCFQSTWELVLE